MAPIIAPAAAPVNCTPGYSAAELFADIAPETEPRRRARLDAQYADYDRYIEEHADELAEMAECYGLYEDGLGTW